MYPFDLQLAVVHTSHMINEAPRQSVLPPNAGLDYMRKDTLQEQMRAYPQRSDLLGNDISRVSKGSSEL